MNQHRGLRLLQASLKMRRQLNRLSRSGYLTQGEYLVLRHIWHADQVGESRAKQGSIKAAELSKRLDRPRPAITRILNDLERRGLITRSIDPTDRRSIDIALTEAGEAALKQANETVLQVADQIVLSLGVSDTEKLIQLLDRLTEIYREILGEAGGNSGE
ncbi:MAG TPA: MarR family transcriptional regulator [Firmicutes bacterium]|nr:MarR family transcriptional regulator [Bacillota bacterium]